MDDEKDRTLWCGNLHEEVTEEMLYELFVQAGPLDKVKIPQGKGYSFITFKHPCSVPYTMQLMDGIRLFARPLKLQARSGSVHTAPHHNGASPGMPNMNSSPMMSNMNSILGTPTQFHRSYSAPMMSPMDPSHNQLHNLLTAAMVQQGIPMNLPPPPHMMQHQDVSRIRGDDRGRRDSSASNSSTPEHRSESRWRPQEDHRRDGRDKYRGDRGERRDYSQRDRSQREYSSTDTGSDSGHRRNSQSNRNDRRNHYPY